MNYDSFADPSRTIELKRRPAVKNIMIVKLSRNSILLITLPLLFAASLFYLGSCGSGGDGSGADGVLTSFSLAWPEGFDSTCGSGYPVAVTITALDGDGAVLSWSGVVDIILTNDAVAVTPDSIELTGGTASTSITFTHDSGDAETTGVKISHDTVVSTLENTVTIHPNTAGVSLERSSLYIVEDDSERLVATVTPAHAWNRTVTWDSSNDAVASVDSTGLVTANTLGEATITVTAEEGGYTDSGEIVVTIIRWQTMLDGPGENRSMRCSRLRDLGLKFSADWAVSHQY